MGLFDSLMSGATGIMNKVRGVSASPSSAFADVGRTSIKDFVSTTKQGQPTPYQTQPSQQDVPQQQAQEDMPIDYLPDLITRDIPEGAQIIGQEALNQYPEGSDISNIMKKGYSLVSDPKSQSIIGVSDKFGHLMSPSEALNQKPVEQILQENGFHTTPDNVDRFLKTNRDISLEPKDLDFTGLNPVSNPVVLKSPVESVLDSIVSAPVLAGMAGITNPFEIMGEGFKRWESLKTSILMGAGIPKLEDLANVIKSPTGEARTKFPDASLRTSNMPELGDVFRQMNMPEIISAVGGLGLDIVTDAGIGTGLWGGLKKALSMSKIGGMNGLDYVIEKTRDFRAIKGIKMIEDMLRGKRDGDIANAPAFNQKRRILDGEKRLAMGDAGNASSEFIRIAQLKQVEEVLSDGTKRMRKRTKEEIADVFKRADEALRDPARMANGNGLSAEELTPLRAMREALDKGSRDIADEILHLIDKGYGDKLQKHMEIKTGKLIPIDQLPEVIAKHDGEYLKRAYLMFQEGWKKPVGEKFDNAVEGLIREYGLSREKAIQTLDEFAKTKELRLPINKISNINLNSINKGSFIARQYIPDYIREFMGEIKDPVYNTMNTMRNLADSRFKFKFFRMLDEMGLASDKMIAGSHENLISAGDSIAWGAIANKWVPDDVHAMLEAVREHDNIMEKPYMKVLRTVKGLKTVGSISGHIRQSVQNMGVTAGLLGVTPFNPKNWKYYWNVVEIFNDTKKMLNGVVKKGDKNFERILKNYETYREMIKDTIIGPDMPMEDIGGYVEKMLKDPFGVQPIEGGSGSMFEKMRRGIKVALKAPAELWAVEDQIPKMAAYLKKTSMGMTGPEATEEIYKFVANYAEASRLAKYVRNNPIAMTFLTPFFTFRSEMHRVMLNVLKEGTPVQKAWLAAMVGGRAATNVAMLSYAGAGLKDIKEYFMSKPDAISESLLNPLAMESGQFDLNLKYVDPFNTRGLWSPLLAYSGATGVHPLDYLLDFTNFSPEFGYGAIVPDSVEGLITGRGKFGQELSAMDRMKSFITGAGPSSATNALKAIDPSLDKDERIRRAARTFGLDFEQRNAKWVRPTVMKRLEQKIANGEDPTSTLKAIDIMGFDSQKMLKQITKKLDKGKPIKKKQMSAKDEMMDKALASYGFK